MEHREEIQEAGQHMEPAMIECEELVKIYATDEQKVMALQGLDLVIARGELMAIIGKSGSGKSTLIQMIGGLETPTAGRLLIEGRDLAEYGERELLEYRRRRVGFVWQNSGHNLFPFLTALENVESRMLFMDGGNAPKKTEKERRKRAYELLKETGVENCADRYPDQLSGGENQRVAIAVALAGEPSILLADEPTGAVDAVTADQIFSLLFRLNRERGLTILIVTHDIALSEKVDRSVQISDGKISREREQEVQEEFVVMDRAHRLQLGEELLKEAGIDSNRVKVGVVDGRIVITK